MSKKENFNKAVFDMFGVGSDTAAAPEHPQAEAAQEIAPDEGLTTRPVEAVAENAPQHAAPYVLVPSTYLAAGTTMEGTLKSKGDVEIAGVFSGEIESEGDVTVRTKLTGNITAANLNVVDCELEGDCHVSGKMQVSEKSQVTGNFFVGDMVCAGAIVGDTLANGTVTLSPSARVTGDVTTGSVSIERGAYIDGKLSMSK